MRSSLRLSGLALALVSTLAACSGEPIVGGYPATNDEPAPVGAQSVAFLAEAQQVRAATAAYADEARARADGFVQYSSCVESPLGGMGVLYVHPDRIDGRLDPLAPEGLIYVPTAEGLRLAGVKYIVQSPTAAAPSAQQPVALAPSPSVFGRTFYGPIGPDAKGDPRTYEFYAWLHVTNPAGVFAPWNPDARCP